MLNCIFAPHCTEQICDKSCPIYTETTYLLERNGITQKNPVFNLDQRCIDKGRRILSDAEGSLKVVTTDGDTNSVSNILTYLAICDNWKGSRLSCSVYNLKFSKFIESTQKSWNQKNPSSNLEYEQIWAQTSKVLIISNLDFVQFKDFQAQTLLNIVQDRRSEGLTTIIVTPGLNSLIGSGSFFSVMQMKFEGQVVKWLFNQ